jgi:TRAP-type C4-dicarboxylate transport system permease large subunit
MGLLVALVYAVVAYAQMGSMMSDMLHPTDPAAHARVAAWQAANYHFSLRMVITSIVGGILGGFAVALEVGIVAVATDQLLGRRGEEHLSEVFK